MRFQQISSAMKQSKIVKIYIFFWLVLLIAFAIGAFIYLNSLPNFSIIISALIASLSIILLISGFFFRSKFLLLRSFLEGDKTGIKFEIVIVIVALVVISVLYKHFLEKLGMALLLVVLIAALAIIVFDFLRLKELKPFS